MDGDDDMPFRPRPKGARSATRDGKRTASFLSKARRLAGRQAGSGPGHAVGRSNARFNNSGRGAALARAGKLQRGGGQRSATQRRVVVKARVIKLAGSRAGAAAHLRYIQRDGTSRDGERGQLYSASDDHVDGDAFLDRGKEDFRQFRFIVAPEDGADLADLSAYTRDLMQQMEADLGTGLDWVAVNHFNTGHPHTHVIIRGVDDRGDRLFIAGDYIGHELRRRAEDLATLELGPQTQQEIQRKLTAEIDQDRFTSIDRAMLREADGGVLDLRPAPADAHAISDRALRLGRLAKLERMGLASQHAPGVWVLDAGIEPTLRELGMRGDIIKTMHQALADHATERDPAGFIVHGNAPDAAIVGRVVGKHLTDELSDDMTLILDGIDGRVHHVAGVSGADADEVAMGSIVEVAPAQSGIRPADRAIADIAMADGIYRPSAHLRELTADPAIPEQNREGLVEASVRRLEALRRAGLVERIDADHWQIPADFDERVLRFEAQRLRQVNLRILSVADLEAQIVAPGSTWLDRTLLSPPSSASAAGFGAEVDQALQRRTDHHLATGDATRSADGRILYRRNLLMTLERRDLDHAGAELAASRNLPFKPAASGETVTGTFSRTVQLSSGKYALIENSREFTLVPWRPVIDTQLGREVTGLMRGNSISWQLGRSRGLGL